MSDTDQEKTEEPTGKKLEKARGEGDIAKSQEVSNWFALLSMAAITAFFLPSVASSFVDVLSGILASAHDLPLDIGQLTETAWGLTLTLVVIAAIPAFIVVVSALASGLIQTQGFLFTTKPLKPELSKIGFKRGFKKIFSANSLVEFLKGIVKIIIVTAVVIYVIWPDRDQIGLLISLEMPAFAEMLRREILKVLVAVFAVMSLIVIVDVSFQRYQHRKKLRMTKQEVKDEHKNTEGDPKVKGRLRRIRIERARQRIMAAVPQADLVVTNPTHYAVALKYDQEAMEAPRLTAKGVDDLALKIREVAREYKVPIVENPPLARALHAGVELEQQIPPEHYKAVAEVIGYVMRVHGKLRSARERELKGAAERRKRRARRDESERQGARR